MTQMAAFPKAKTKRQRVDATSRLFIERPELRREILILEKLINTAVRTLIRPAHRASLKTRPALYSRYRGNAFPLRDYSKRKLNRWRNTSLWLKTQIAALCLADKHFLQIRLHPHDELRDQVGDLRMKQYLRDRLVRCLRSEFHQVPWFYIVIEDRDSDGLTAVRPHLHGAIQVPRSPVPTIKNGRPTARYRRLISKFGLEAAEFVAGRERVNRALKRATGNDGKRPEVVRGRSQLNNVWKRKAYMPLRNSQWVSYALKNMNAISPSLPENRLSMSRALNQEAQRLWELIRKGESAVDQWD